MSLRSDAPADLPGAYVTPFELRARPELVTELRSNPGAMSERRLVPSTIETRAAEEGDGYLIAGHAAVFNELSDNLGGFREKIDRGAFRKVLRNDPDTWALGNHDMNLIFGRTLAGTLVMQEDGTGLAYEANAPDTQYARDWRALFERGDVTQSSFSFRVADDSWDEDEETGGLIRTIHEFSALYDVSPCIYPAYPQTDAGTRSLEGLEKLRRGQTITAEERAEVEALLEQHTSTERGSSEQDTRADGQEPGEQADESEGRAEVGSAEAQGGLSPAAARLRMRERMARI